MSWPQVRLDRIFQLRNEPARDADEPVSAFIDGKVTLRSNRPENIIKNSGMEAGYKHIEAGDLVVSGMNAHLGGLGISDSSGKCTPVYTVMYPIAPVAPRYISYWLWHAAKSGYIGSLATGIRYNSSDFSAETVKRIFVDYPPLEDQRRIADFLDDQIGRIEQIIQLRKNQVEGLDEHADSFRRWLHLSLESESGWTQSTVGRSCQATFGAAFSSAEFTSNGEVPVVRMGDIGALGFVNYISRKHVPDKVLLRDGDVVFGMSGNFQVEVWSRGEAALNQRVAGIRWPFDSHLLSSFIGPQLREFSGSLGGTTLSNLSSQQVRNLKVWIPEDPKVELQLVSIEKDERQRLSSLMDSITDGIQVLEERKRSLISAAVTGQFDVSTVKRVKVNI